MQTAVVLEDTSPYVPNNYVKAWEMLIHEMFNEFIYFFVPDIYDEIDFTTAPQFLQQDQLQEVLKENPSIRSSTQLIIARLLNGKEKWILVHCDFNKNMNETFRRRMFHYFYLIYDRYDQKVYPIALLYQKGHARIDYYDFHDYGTSLIYKYNVFTVMDQDLGKLEKSSNPFAVIMLAIIYSIHAKDHMLLRFYYKRNLMLHVLKRYVILNETSRSAIFYFIDITLPLPDALQHRLREEMNKK